MKTPPNPATQEQPDSPGDQPAANTFKWLCWDAPERIAAHPRIKDEVGGAFSRLSIIAYRNGSTRLTATRRPQTILRDSIRLAKTFGTEVVSMAVSEPMPGLGRARDTLSKRLELDGHKNLGGGLFRGTSVKVILLAIHRLYPEATEPAEPELPEECGMETNIPEFLRKERSMDNHPITQPQAGDGLIPVLVGEIGGVQCNVCDARALHGFLEVGKHFGSWIQDRIDKYQFVENQDFMSFSQNREKPQGGRPVTEYRLTLDMAKELSMVENNEKGRQARRYFIECERRVLEELPRIGHGHDEIEQAIDARVWRLAEEERKRLMGLLGGKSEHEGPVWDMAYRMRENFRETMRHIVATQLRKRPLNLVLAHIATWKPLNLPQHFQG